ncbi:hypothetical protein BU17DRAFT_78528 [Hysterangium stoloniferum]|nr:hypothetical protein BU17DRAFT_78528 [Hysterangium stoloniferum]
MSDEGTWERGLTIFKAIEKDCHLHAGYTRVVSIDVADPSSIHNKSDIMPNYALAETWTSMFLLFSLADPLS